MEAEQEKETRMQQFRTVGHNHSHDSAIDADLQEWETEILDIDLVSFSKEIRKLHKLIFVAIMKIECLFKYNTFPTNSLFLMSIH
jgi:hypothetical protein